MVRRTGARLRLGVSSDALTLALMQLAASFSTYGSRTCVRVASPGRRTVWEMMQIYALVYRAARDS
jgi:hypothetical protein